MMKLTDVAPMKLSLVKEAMPAVEDYLWHCDALQLLQREHSQIDVQIDGKSIVMGAYNEPPCLEAFHNNEKLIKEICVRYLESTISLISQELRSAGVDPES